MIGVMGACACILPTRITRCDKWDLLLLVIFLIQLSSYYIHPKAFRLSTVLYSGLFYVQIITFRTLAKDYLRVETYNKFVKALIYLFFIVLIIQQLSELAHIDGFNRFGFFEARWKMNSLAQEPSFLPGSMILLMLSYVRTSILLSGEKTYDIKNKFKEDKYIWLAFFYTVVGCGTTAGIFALPFFLLYFVKDKVIRKLPFFATAVILLFLLISFLFPYVQERFNNVFSVITKMDPYEMYDQDPSASARIAPYMFLLKEFTFSKDFIWGHGIDYATHYFSFELVGEELDAGIGIGGIVNFLYDYGFIAFILFMLYLRHTTLKSFLSYNALLWFGVFSISQINIALCWAFIAFMESNAILEAKHQKKETVVSHYKQFKPGFFELILCKKKFQ
jgi:hypothetical protein